MPRRLLLPLVPLYGAAVAVKRWLYDRGVLKANRLPHPVISVGSLSAGGAGKTPVVVMLAELLGREGFEVRILTRGYRRAGTATERVALAEDGAGDAARFGDEPLLLARRLPDVAVYVGADRYQAGLLAGRDDTDTTRAVYLLDDGFQHWKLARDIDVVLLTQRDIEDRLLPAGDLREPLQALRRAGIVLVRAEEAGVAEFAQAGVAGGSAPVWRTSRRLQFDPEKMVPSRALAFCGVARPENFTALLGSAGVVPVFVKAFRDHHAYSLDDIEELVKSARLRGADGFITTEKDAVKLNTEMMARLEVIGPVVVAPLEVDLVDERACVDQFMALLGGVYGK